MLVCRCEKCRSLFYEPEVRTVSESRGEYWGFPAYENVNYAYCPVCGADEDYLDLEYFIDDEAEDFDPDDLEVF